MGHGTLARTEKRLGVQARMEHGLQISLKRYALSMEGKVAAGAFGALQIMGNTDNEV